MLDKRCGRPMAEGQKWNYFKALPSILDDAKAFAVGMI